LSTNVYIKTQPSRAIGDYAVDFWYKAYTAYCMYFTIIGWWY